MDISAVWFS